MGDYSEEYDFAANSRVKMAKGYITPSDQVLLSCAVDSPKYTTQVATCLVMGFDYEFDTIPTDQETADICMLNLVIEFARKVGDRNLQRFCDMPIEYLRRWNKFVAENLGNNDTPSVKEIEDMYGME